MNDYILRVCKGRRWKIVKRILIVLTVAIVTAAMLAASAFAALAAPAPGEVVPLTKEICEEFKAQFEETGEPFKNFGRCVSAANHGTLVKVAVNDAGNSSLIVINGAEA
jgi:hypothetical protein